MAEGSFTLNIQKFSKRSWPHLVWKSPWGDINFALGTMGVTRSIVCGVVGPCKTESSQKPVPVHPTVLETLAKWKEVCRYTKPDDWVFASRQHRDGSQSGARRSYANTFGPLRSASGFRNDLVGHTFRHTYSTLLRSVGTEFKVMQELLRHSSLISTLDVYTQAISPAKHAAQAAVLALVFAPETNSHHNGLNGVYL